MTYRISKNCFYEDSENACSLFESAVFQLERLNARLHEISKKLIETEDICFFDPFHKDCRQAIYELGSITDRDVMSKIYTLDGYLAFHQTLKKLNADFHFQILPSAGMVRPAPVLMMIVERFRNYASNLNERNRHMYPDFGANDNGGLGLWDERPPAAASTAPIHFCFS